MSDVSAKAGTTLRIAIPILKTHPIPTAEWTLNDQPIGDDATIEVSIGIGLNDLQICTGPNIGSLCLGHKNRGSAHYTQM